MPPPPCPTPVDTVQGRVKPMLCPVARPIMQRARVKIGNDHPLAETVEMIPPVPHTKARGIAPWPLGLGAQDCGGGKCHQRRGSDPQRLATSRGAGPVADLGIGNRDVRHDPAPYRDGPATHALPQPDQPRALTRAQQGSAIVGARPAAQNMIHPAQVDGRGTDEASGSLLSYVDLEGHIPSVHPLRQIRRVVNDALASLDADSDALCTNFGHPSIPPERLIRASLIQILCSVRSERQRMEQMDMRHVPPPVRGTCRLRSGLIVQGDLTRADGRAERRSTLRHGP